MEPPFLLTLPRPVQTGELIAEFVASEELKEELRRDLVATRKTPA